jgi:hypothetical protein
MKNINYPHVIAIHGRKRSGKGTIADYLTARHQYVVIKFADPLKDMLKVLLQYWNFDEETILRCLEGDLKEVPLKELGGKTSRFAMQTLGTEWRELIDSGLWVNIAIHRIRQAIQDGKRVVVDDLRFPHEALALQGLDIADLWMVGNSRIEDFASKDTHSSEQVLDKNLFSAFFRNDDTFEYLYNQIEARLYTNLQA